MNFSRLLQRPLLLLFALSILLHGCAESNTQLDNHVTLASLAADMQVSYTVVDNQATHVCEQAEMAQCFIATLDFVFPYATPAQPWSIYFGHLSPVQAIDNEDFSLTHVNGDLHRVHIKRAFAANETLTIKLIADFWHVSRSDVLPNMYLQQGQSKPHVVVATKTQKDPNTQVDYAGHVSAFTHEKQMTRGVNDKLAIADSAWLYDYYKPFNTSNTDTLEDATPRVIPKVASETWTGNHIDLPHGLQLDVLPLASLEGAMSELKHVGISPNDLGLPVVYEQTDLARDAYSLSLRQDKIIIRANDNNALGYGLLTLSQLYNGDDKTLPEGDIEDMPLYQYRGMHIDIARNFQGVKSLYRLIDEMYFSKLNRLHLHFADDEGWRVEIEEFPLLTEFGGYRCADTEHCLLPQLGAGPFKDTPVNGYLSQQNYLDILQYAHARNIEVIPSFDIPGHARAAVQSMEKRYTQTEDARYRLIDPLDNTDYSSIQYYNDNTLNPCLESSYLFIDTVINRLQSMHEQAGVPLNTFHMGADETAGAWLNSPKCKALLGRDLTKEDVHKLLGIFVERIYKSVTTKGLQLAGWSDGMSSIPAEKRSDNLLVTIWSTLASGGDAVAHDWNSSTAHGIYSFPDVLYFDFPHQNHPHEPGYYWASKNTDVFKVFQFTPQVLSVHQYLWTDRMGVPFTSSEKVSDSNALGIQGQLWSEIVRSPQTLEYMLYPRLYALAERAWSQPQWHSAAEDVVNNNGEGLDGLLNLQQQSWHAFAKKLVSHVLPRLSAKGMNFHLPAPGVINSEQDNTSTVMVNTHFPELIVETKINGIWTEYRPSQKIAPLTRFRTRLPESNVASRSVCYLRCDE